jgi:hypothetical protein
VGKREIEGAEEREDVEGRREMQVPLLSERLK